MVETLIGTYAAAAVLVGVYAALIVVGTRRVSLRVKRSEGHEK
jgi:hypothetical protein